MTKITKTFIPQMDVISRLFASNTNDFLESKGIAEPRLTEWDVLPALAGILSTAVTFHCIHEKGNWAHADNGICQILPWYESGTDLSNEYFAAVVDDTYLAFMDLICELSPNVWEQLVVSLTERTLTKTDGDGHTTYESNNGGVLLIQSLGDYRINEWTRLVREGVIAPPSSVTTMTESPIAVNQVIEQELEKRITHVTQNDRVVCKAAIKETPEHLRALMRVRPKENEYQTGIVAFNVRVARHRPERFASILDIEHYLGGKLSTELKTAMQTEGYNGNNTVLFSIGETMVSIETVWREDTQWKRWELRDMAHRMAAEPDDPQLNEYVAELLKGIDQVTQNRMTYGKMASTRGHRFKHGSQ